MGAGFCLGLRLGSSTLLFPLPGWVRSPSERGHLTRGGWNVVTWPADPGLIRAEQGHRENEQVDPARQWTGTQTPVLPEPGASLASSRELWAAQLPGQAPAPLPSRKPPPRHGHRSLTLCEVPGFGFAPAFPPSLLIPAPNHVIIGAWLSGPIWAALGGCQFFHAYHWYVSPAVL